MMPLTVAIKTVPDKDISTSFSIVSLISKASKRTLPEWDRILKAVGKEGNKILKVEGNEK